MNSNFLRRLRGPSMAIAIGVGTLVAAWLLATPAHAAPPAGTVIGNQATATYQDAGGIPRSTASNLVQTTVSQVKSFTLTANGAKTAAPGQTVYYPHTLTNTGNGADTYALTAPVAGGGFTHGSLVYYQDANADGVPDNFTPITSTGPLPAGTAFTFVVAGTVPAATSAGTTGTITVAASDTGGNSAANTDTTTVANSVINVTKAMSATSGASPSAAAITVTLSYINSGTAAASNVTLTDALPSGMAYVASSGRWSASGATALGDGAGGDAPGIDYGFSGNTVTAVIASVPAGVSGTLTFQINIAAGLSPTTPANAALTTNSASYASTTQGQSNTNSVTYQVLQVASVSASGQTVASAPQGGTVSFANIITNTGNGADSFDVTLPAAGSPGNSFPVGTTFALFRADGLTSLLDSNGNGTPDTGPLAAGANFTVVLRATLPPGAMGGPFAVGKVAASRFDPTKTATATDTLNAIVAATMDLTQNTARTDSSPAGTATAGNAATTGFGAGTASAVQTNAVTPNATNPTTTTFRLVLNNTSASSDSYDLTASGLPAGWSATFYADAGGSCATLGSALVNSGSIAAGANTAVCAVVTVPPIASGNSGPGTSNLTFQARSPITPTSIDTLVDAVQINAVHNVTLTPNGAQQTFAGGAVTYSHTLRNNGNASETISFASGFLSDSQAAAGWTSAAYIDSNGDGVLTVGTDTLISTATSFALAANAQQTLFVRVFAPASATAASPADVTTLTATYNAGASSASVNDTTAVTNGLLLAKAQVAGDCAAALVAGPFSAAAIAAGINTQPGKCVAYQITATNTAAGSIANVVLSDFVPSNTTLASTSCAAPAASGGAAIGGTATSEGATGTVTATLASLASTASFQLTFCVRINP